PTRKATRPPTCFILLGKRRRSPRKHEARAERCWQAHLFSPLAGSQVAKRSSKGKRRCGGEARLGGFAAALKVRKGGRGGDRTGCSREWLIEVVSLTESAAVKDATADDGLFTSVVLSSLSDDPRSFGAI